MAPKANGPRQRLGGRSIRTRILMIGWVPSVSLLLIGVVLASVLAYNFWDLRRANLIVENNLDTTQAFIPEIRRELLLSAAYLADPESGTGALDAQRARTDQALFDIQQDSAAISGGTPQDLDVVFSSFTALAGQITSVRDQIDQRESSVLDATQYWGDMIGEIADSVAALASVAPNGSASVQENRAAQLITVVEKLSQGNGLAYVAFSNEGLTDEEYQTFVKTAGTYRDDLDELADELPADEQTQLKQITSSQAWRQQAQIEQAVLGAHVLTAKERRDLAGGVPDGTLTVTDVDPTRAQLNNGNLKAVLPIASSAWETADDEVTQALTDLAMVQLSYSSDLAVSAADTRVHYAVYGGAFAILYGVAVFLLATRESGRLAARLRGLRDETLDLARHRLPALVENLRVGEIDPKNRTLPRLSYGRDEIGEVAEAFNHAHDVAVGAAVQEAETRAGLREVFLNIAYRSQVIVHRQLGVLEKAEQFEEDPEQLQLLFELDHLATRSRRNAENLVILGGGQPGRRWRNSVELLQVVRSAISEAQDYARVSIGRLPRLAIHGAAVADIIHLLAELVDNATSFSPPMSKVEVRGNLVGKGLVIEIEDQGLGIPADKMTELNEMLTAAPDFHALTLREEPRLGMFVVAQLAAGQNIRVTLTPSPAYGGTKAVVLIPAELFETLSGHLDTGTLSLEGRTGQDEPVVSTTSVRSVHERMAITGEMTGEMTGEIAVVGSASDTSPGASGEPGAGKAAPARSVRDQDQAATAEPAARPTAGRLERLVRRDSLGSTGSTRNTDHGTDQSTDSTGQREPDVAPGSGPMRHARANGRASSGSAGSVTGTGSTPTLDASARVEHLTARQGGATGSGLPVRTPGSVRPGAGAAAATPPAGLLDTRTTGSARNAVAGSAAAKPVVGTDGSAGHTSSGTSSGRPELPRRVRQANLSERLRKPPAPGTETGPQSPTSGAQTDPETARSRMSAFQRGTQRGRTERPDQQG